MNVPVKDSTLLSLNNFQKLAKPSKMGICELVFCLVVLFWYYFGTKVSYYENGHLFFYNVFLENTA